MGRKGGTNEADGRRWGLRDYVACLLLALTAVGSCAALLPPPYDGLPLVPILIAPGVLYLLPALLAMVLFKRCRVVLRIVCLVLGFGIALWHSPMVATGSDRPFEATVTQATYGESETITIMSVNTWRGKPNTWAIVQYVKDEGIDVLFVQEATVDFTAGLEFCGIQDVLPYSAGKATGNQIWSSLPLSLVVDDAIGYSGCRMPAANIQVGQKTIRLVSVHTCSPIPGYEDKWQESLDCLANYGKHDPYMGSADYYILAGDFNATFDHGSFRAILHDRLVDLSRRNGQILVPSWPSVTHLPLFEIDHFVASRELGSGNVSAVRVEGTDHMAITCTVSVPTS